MGKLDRPAPALPGPLARSLYRIDRSFEENAALGPDFDGPFPPVPATPMTEFFGLPVASRIGVAASLVLNRHWARTLGRLGFDLLTYKTVRSCRRLAHPAPNWLYPDPDSVADGGGTLRLGSALPADPAAATALGSIGMPSVAPDVWRQDIRATRDGLDQGQVLIVSVVGTVQDSMPPEALVQDLATLAADVVAAGAQAVELNLSCPNVSAREGELFLDTGLAAAVAAEARARLDAAVPLLVKIGAIDDEGRMAALLTALDPHVDGVVMINAPRRILLPDDGAPAFGSGRAAAGLMGGATFDIGLTCVRQAVAVVRARGLRLRILAVGGVTSPERVAACFEAGAYAVLAASALAWDPYLALRVKSRLPEV